MVGGEVAEDLFDRGLCLPSGTAMTEGDLDRVIEKILNCRKKALKTLVISTGGRDLNKTLIFKDFSLRSK